MNKFEQNIINIYGRKGYNWLLRLPQKVDQIAHEWALSDLSTLQNLSHNYVLTATQNTKVGACVTRVVLKISINTQQLAQETQALKAFANYGTARLIDQREDAVLLERVVPGKPLKIDLEENKQNLQIFCEIMNKLHQAPVPHNSSFPHIRDMLSILDQEWDLPADFLIKARHLKNKLLSNTDTPLVLLHGDLHHDNVLSTQEGWQVIDPKGIRGYWLNEIWAFILDPWVDTHWIANYYQVDIKDVRAWYFVHLIMI